MPEVTRFQEGLAVAGERYRVVIQPRSYPFAHDESDVTLLIAVDARSQSWGNEWARISGDAVIPARRQDVRLVVTAGGSDELQVLLARHADLPEFRTGITLRLEPGMRDSILAALPRVERVAQQTTAVCRAIEPMLGRTLDPYAPTVLKPHEVNAIAMIVAGIVLQDKGVPDAIRWSVLLPPEYATWAFGENGDHPHYAELGTALRQPAVQAMLAEAGHDVRAWRPTTTGSTTW
ncbi:hypothetical protein [Burkholderia cenocepacia]|uniref:hypothetical protein n=1 Tax=Burkholderia cenocepacia TaxID=95486 RepID=UPI0013DED253|nr:hypothetical protein [Burkholderia cenocepacia]MCW3587339.1 hypothetical protein [Burkholderia cenocepacia]MCW3632543.1 hypothetical protein [Burkholderia cenocepacia]MCW5181774.1 hypothetical protein [Burkholderia cenocepacia]NGO98092.1 hypothetical protein [Burkholderia cenocepacia]